MRALLAGLGRVLGVQVALRLGDGLSPRASRALLALVVLVAGLAPVAAVLTGAIGYGDVWLWLAIEVLTIYAWTMVRLVRAHRVGANGSVVVLLTKLALELALVLAWEVREGQLTIFGKPVVFRVRGA